MDMQAATLPWPVAEPHCIRVTVGAEDIDAFEHTNNVSYLRWLEQCAWSHTCALGLDMDAYRRIGTGCVARRHELDYLAASFEGDELIVGTWIEENDGRVTMWRGYRIFRAADARAKYCARARSGPASTWPAAGRSASRRFADRGDEPPRSSTSARPRAR